MVEAIMASNIILIASLRTKISRLTKMYRLNTKIVYQNIARTRELKITELASKGIKKDFGVVINRSLAYIEKRAANNTTNP
jgi:hypothetical protein